MIHIDNKNKIYKMEGTYHDIMADVTFVLAELGEQLDTKTFAKLLDDVLTTAATAVLERKKEGGDDDKSE